MVPDVILVDRPRSIGRSDYMVNNRGVRLCPHSEEAKALLIEFKYRPLILDKVNDDYIYDKVLMHRYRGGLGDLLTIKVGIVNICALGADCVLAIPTMYHFLFRDVKDLELVDYRELFGSDYRHTIRYFDVRDKYHLAIDLFCPAGLHETATNNRPEKGRIRIFAELLEKPLCAPTLKLTKK